MPPKMDEDMVDLANRLGEDRFEVFNRAMALYIAIKNRHLDQLKAEGKDLKSPLRVFLETQSKKIEFISN